LGASSRCKLGELTCGFHLHLVYQHIAAVALADDALRLASAARDDDPAIRSLQPIPAVESSHCDLVIAVYQTRRSLMRVHLDAAVPRCEHVLGQGADAGRSVNLQRLLASK